eukprot:CAMPEP_0178913164 /NCGR_PEP_ID=MMETSP0786-20121207/10685_1 /TAXON_ID=186022 /ORGANISM="Thalassionema frauenfeldii, Strain CCMP 1798" /LENGTH=435 /DNA_ID=CAMNT_0020585865 /DNA_START=79 /DNA_END=1386 /DNA_ORIENTATION=+
MKKLALITKSKSLGKRLAVLSHAFSSTSKSLEEEAKSVFYVPRAERAEKAVFKLESNVGDVRLFRYDRACPTRELNFTPETWKMHKSPYRKFRHILSTFGSSPFQRLMIPDLVMVSAVSVGLSYYNVYIAAPEAQVSLDMGSFAGITSAIGMLAGFRLNASYGRYEECRIFWGETNNTIRDLAQQTMMYMRDEDQRSRMLKLCKAYPVALNFHLNAKGGHHNIRRTEVDVINMIGDSPMHLETEEPKKKKHDFNDRVQAEFEAEMRDIYADGRHEDDYDRICKIKYSGANTPIEMLTLMRETIAGCINHGCPAILVRAMDWQCERLCGVFGASERVLRTALPTGFTRHSSRLMFLWSNLLPFAIYPAMGPIGTLPVSLIGAYALLGIDDVSVQLEEPFDILPLRQYSDGMFDAIGQIERNYVPYIPPSAVSKGSD